MAAKSAPSLPLRLSFLFFLYSVLLALSWIPSDRSQICSQEDLDEVLLDCGLWLRLVLKTKSESRNHVTSIEDTLFQVLSSFLSIPPATKAI